MGHVQRCAHRQHQFRTLTQQVGNQFADDIVLRVDEGRRQFRRHRHHIVANQVDGIVLHGIVTHRQHLYRSSLHAVFVIANGHLSSLAWL